MTVYDSYTILNPAPGKYEADHPLVIGVNQSRVKTTINVPDIFAAGRYYFRGVNTIISGVVASDAGKPAYIEANLQDGEIGAGTLTLLSVPGVEANFPYSIKRVPLFETEIDASEIDTSGLVTKDTFNSTVARIDADIQKGDTDLRLDLDALTSRFTQLSSEINAELDTFDESLGQIETEVKNLASEVDGYDARITNAENAASSANTVAQAASSAASAAQNTANEAKTEIAPLDAKVTQLETDVETAEVTANTAKTTADEAKTNADDAIQRAINARLEANKANDAVKLVQADLDKLEETVSTGSSDLTALTGRVTTAEGKITTLEGKVTTAESDISAVETTTAHLSDSVGLLTTQVESNATQIESLQAKADRALISSLQLVGTPISNVDNFFAIPFNALSVEFTIRFPAGATINGSIIGVSYYSTSSAIASQLIATQNMLGRDALTPPNSLLLKLDLVNQSAILCKNVAVSNNSGLQEASDVYGNTYFKNAGISGNGMIRGVAFKFTNLGTPVVSALAVTARVGTRYSASGGSP